jgi:AcrR family transcriptional regulator
MPQLPSRISPARPRVRDPIALRQTLLDHAEELFFARGYDRTSVEDVLAAASSTKGAFYHHFPSKEALLEALADRLAERSVAGAAEVLDDASLDAITRLNAVFAGSRRLKLDAAPLMRRTLPVIFRPENIALRHRITAATIARVAPILAVIVEQGCREGVFDSPDPLGSAELLLQLGTIAHDTIARAIEAADAGDVDAAAEMLERRLRLVELAFNRVLGLPDGTVTIAEPGFAAAVVCAK